MKRIKKRINIHLYEDQVEKLDEMAGLTGTTRAHLVRVAIDNHVNPKDQVGMLTETGLREVDDFLNGQADS